MTPGGRTLVGVDGGFVPGEGSGVLTQGAGEIQIYANGSIPAGAEPRIFTTFWRQHPGVVGAGRYQRRARLKSTVVYTPQRRVYDSIGLVTLSPTTPNTGAGIATLNPIPEVPPGDIDLIAPLGTIDAGEAGIRVSGNVNPAALRVVNAENIQVQGKATGVPVLASVNVGALSNASAVASQAVSAAQDAMQRERTAARARACRRSSPCACSALGRMGTMPRPRPGKGPGGSAGQLRPQRGGAGAGPDGAERSAAQPADRHGAPQSPALKRAGPSGCGARVGLDMAGDTGMERLAHSAAAGGGRTARPALAQAVVDVASLVLLHGDPGRADVPHHRRPADARRPQRSSVLLAVADGHRGARRCRGDPADQPVASAGRLHAAQDAGRALLVLRHVGRLRHVPDPRLEHGPRCRKWWRRWWARPMPLAPGIEVALWSTGIALAFGIASVRACWCPACLDRLSPCASARCLDSGLAHDRPGEDQSRFRACGVWVVQIPVQPAQRESQRTVKADGGIVRILRFRAQAAGWRSLQQAVDFPEQHAADAGAAK
ncbi:filamentous hemagglutinin family protein [Cupriavidus basilensis]